MVLALLFAATVLAAGFAVVRLAGINNAVLQFGLAPAAGLAALSVVASWYALLAAPEPFAWLTVYGLAGLGLFLTVRDRHHIGSASLELARTHSLAMLTLAAALIVPTLLTAFVFASASVPLSPHDGAAHVEAIQAVRSGEAWTDWYPPGTASLFATWLMPFAAIDSALGGLDLGTSLPLLAVISVFGLGVATWRDLQIAAAAALLFSLTYLFPYFPQLWSGWPLSISLIAMLGVWAGALEYLHQPSLRWAGLVGLLLGAIVLVHGTELYTVTLVFLVLVVAYRERLAWQKVPTALLVAAVIALVCASPYLPILFHWAGSGGAYATGIEDLQAPRSVTRAESGADLLTVFGLEALGIDLPIRILLIAAGCVWVILFRRERTVLAIGLVFTAITVLFSVALLVPPVRQVYASLFPWSQQYRTLIIVAITQAQLAAAGIVAGLRLVWRRTTGPGTAHRRIRRLITLAVVTWFGLATWGMWAFLAFPTDLVLGYDNPDDGAAMAWLRQNAVPGESVVNDRFADAGIWVPFKAGAPVVYPRLMPPAQAEARALVTERVAELDQDTAARAAACALRVAYVYYGAHISGWDERRFPPIETLRASSAMRQVFSHGQATIFRVQLNCP